MPDQEIAFLLDDAVLWPKVGNDPRGQPTVGAPVSLSASNSPPNGVRWLIKRREAVDAKGNTITLNAQVITSQPVLIGSHMWLGNLHSWQGTGSGLVDSEVHVVKTDDTTNDIKGRATFMSYGLMRLHGPGAN